MWVLLPSQKIDKKGFFHAVTDESALYAGLKTLSCFRPELFNKIDEVVVVRSIEKTQACHFEI